MHIKVKIVAIGDSITYGFPYTPLYSWVHLTAEQLGLAIINRGVNGDTTAGMLARFKRDVIKHSPSHVIIMGGTNDAYAGFAVEKISDNIRKMVELAGNNDIIALMGLPIPCGDRREDQLLAKYRKAMQQYAAEKNITVIDFYSDMVTENSIGIKDGLHVDGVHPNEFGYKVMAEVAINVLQTQIVQ